MAKYLQVGVKFWNQKLSRWETISFSMNTSTKITLQQYNVTYKWINNDGTGARHNVEVVGRTNSFGASSCTVKNDISFQMEYDSAGWPVLKITNTSANNWDFQSCIFERVPERLDWIQRYWNCTDYAGDVPFYQWENNTGCIQRPTQLCIENMNSNGYFPSSPGYVYLNSYVCYYCHSYGHLQQNSSTGHYNQMSNILQTILNGNAVDGDNTVNVFNSGYHQWDTNYAASQAWNGPVTSSLVGSSTFSNILSMRKRMGYYSLSQYNPFGTTGNKMCNTSGWWEAHCLRTGSSSGDYPWDLTIGCGPYNALDAYASSKAVSASLFELAVTGSPSISARTWTSPMMGAIDAYSSTDVTSALTNVMHLREYNYSSRPASFTNTINTTLGGPNVSISGGVYPSSAFASQSKGSVGVRFVTYEGTNPVQVTSSNYKHIIDCLIAPSLYSDWNALDIYGLQRNNVSGWGSHFIWDSYMPSNKPNTLTGWSRDQWIKLYSTVNFGG